MDRGVRLEYRRLLEDLASVSIIKVAVNPDADHHIIGWAVGQHLVTPGSDDREMVLHFVWVKERPASFRNYGIATALVQAIRPNDRIGYYTHRTGAVPKFNLEEKWKIRYNPTLLW
jgi:hypothetical protein